jgi:hypothetical protein
MKPADTAAERQACDAGVADEPARGRKPERLRLAVELAPEHAGLNPGRAALRVDPDPIHRPQVDDDAAVADRVAWVAVPSSADGDRQAGAPRELDGSQYVRHCAAAGDQRREAIDRPVPDFAVLVVGGVAGPDQLTLERGAQLAQRGLIDPDVSSDRAHGHSSFTPGQRPSTAGA